MDSLFMMMMMIPVPKFTLLKTTLTLFIVCLAVIQPSVLTIETVQAKRPAKTTATSPLVEQQPSSTTAIEPEGKPAKKKKTKKVKQAAQVTAFELEPPANPDYPTQLCGKRRERLVELQTMPWIIKPFFLGERRIEQWQYRLCLSRTMPEVQRYLESFPVPYTATPAN